MFIDFLWPVSTEHFPKAETLTEMWRPAAQTNMDENYINLMGVGWGNSYIIWQWLNKGALAEALMLIFDYGTLC